MMFASFTMRLGIINSMHKHDITNEGMLMPFKFNPGRVSLVEYMQCSLWQKGRNNTVQISHHQHKIKNRPAKEERVM